jgi:hypothetical protein
MISKTKGAPARRRSLLTCGLLAAALAIGVFGSAAQAAVSLPAARFNAQVNYRYEGCQIDPETCAAEGRLGESYSDAYAATGPFESFGHSYSTRSYYGAEGMADYQHNPTPAPSVTAQAAAFTGSEDPDELSYADVRASLVYGFAISGPDGAVPVTIESFAQLRAEVGGTQYSRASVRIKDESGALVFGYDTDIDGVSYAFTTASPYGGFTNFYDATWIETVSLQANALYTVTLNAYAEASQSGLNGVSYGMAWVDPTFTIDPTFADAAKYRVQVSPGVGNGATSFTPEPGTWALMLLGFGSVGAALRNRRRAVLA